MPADLLLPLVESGAQRVRLAVYPQGAPALPPVAGLLAGAAEVDITPPPGMPKAGHSSNAQTGTGFRTRLRAHVLHLRAGTTSLALVHCDLLAGSAIVAQLRDVRSAAEIGRQSGRKIKTCLTFCHSRGTLSGHANDCRSSATGPCWMR